MDYNTSEENKLDGKLPPTPDNPLLEKVKSTFFYDFFPVDEIKPGVIFMTTREIYMKFQSLYPSAFYSMEDVAQWMFDKGFLFKSIAGNMQYEWMLIPASLINS